MTTEIKEMKADGKCLVYWHKGANSGLWSFNSYHDAKNMAEELAKQEDVYDVTIVTTGSCKVFKKSE